MWSNYLQHGRFNGSADGHCNLMKDGSDLSALAMMCVSLELCRGVWWQSSDAAWKLSETPSGILGFCAAIAASDFFCLVLLPPLF